MDKIVMSLRYWLQGKDYYRALMALEICLQNHTELRKDNVTPFFIHPITITQHIRTFDKLLLFPEKTLIVSLLHDTLEDTDVTPDQLKTYFTLDEVDSIMLLSKNYNTDFDLIAQDPVASVVKPADRVHNQNTCIEVFSDDKITQYIEETKTVILPTVKKSRRYIPRQEPIYENMKLVLNSQVRTLEAVVSRRRTT